MTINGAPNQCAEPRMWTVPARSTQRFPNPGPTITHRSTPLSSTSLLKCRHVRDRFYPWDLGSRASILLSSVFTIFSHNESDGHKRWLVIG